MGTSDTCLWTFVAVLITLIQLPKIFASGNFELQLLEISNTNNHLLTGYCCGVPSEMRHTRTIGCPPCTTAFRLCLKEYQSTTPSHPGILSGCSFGNATSSVLGGSSFVLSDPEIGSIVLPFTFRWTKSFTLILQALDFYNTSYPVNEQLIEETSFSGVILPSPEWNTLDHIGKNARITYRIRVQCAANYYNTTCTTFCRTRNDQFGHYTCGDKGNKVCVSGWQGTNCEKAICKPGCDPVHGKCDQPGECECRPGWRGPLCNECMVYPGCRHGYCNGSAWQCICDTNWGGILCDQDLNYCGTHEPCMHGGTCENTAPDQYRCTCSDGLSGLRCEIVEHPCATQPCKNGGTCTLKDPVKYESNKKDKSDNNGAVNNMEDTTSIIIRSMRGMSSMGKPVGIHKMTNDARSVLLSNAKSTPNISTVEFLCTCSTGWTSSTCEINIDECAGGPCENGGTCVDLIGGFRCECPPQWTGDVCQLDVDECTSNPVSTLGPCINAQSCYNTPGAFSCNCLEGWGGLTCAKDLDDCIGQCRNGATCIDLVNDYHCACAIGYTGRDCETDIDECVGSPCRNGGECVDLVGKFKCICPVGYSGTLCEEAKDHCTPVPCLEGSCLNTPGGYYCHCPPGRSGRHCELTRPPCDNHFCADGCSPSSNDSSSSTAPCSGNGKCEATFNGMHCICHIGYTGIYCEHNLNECSPNPCKNGGICIDGDGDFICECTAGWSGKSCTEKVTQCNYGQCLNGGSCVTSIVGNEQTLQCRCTSAWGGPFCNEPIDQCQGQPCHNGGTCESGSGWFRCLCAKGFSGPDCRINVNECSPQPCLGGATCKDGIGGYTCICPLGRRGPRCEIVQSDPKSVCLNQSTSINLSPYNAIAEQSNNETLVIDESNCNSCVCINGKPKCSNIWCGLSNCLKVNTTKTCDFNEVCVPALQETCLAPTCKPRGDCRSLEPSLRVAPPKLPAPIECWPNQAVLSEHCSRISILLDRKRIRKGTSVDSICFSLRILLGTRLVNDYPEFTPPLLVILCDIKSGNNDTMEVTVSSLPNGEKLVTEAVRLLGELLSRQSSPFTVDKNFNDEIEAAPLAAILEVKVETASISNERNSIGYLIAVACGTAIAAICLGIAATIFWRHRNAEQRNNNSNNSGVNLSPSSLDQRHDDEKSNNIQNEENFRRYANPLKGSLSSLRGTIDLSLQPIATTLDLTSGTNNLAGPSAIHRSQPLFPVACDTDFDKDDHDNNVKTLNMHTLQPAHQQQQQQQQQQQHNQQLQQQQQQHQQNQTNHNHHNQNVNSRTHPHHHHHHHHGSQILLYKAQNPDIRKNTMSSIDSPHKDFGKRSINCQSMPSPPPPPQPPPVSLDSDILTVHV